MEMSIRMKSKWLIWRRMIFSLWLLVWWSNSGYNQIRGYISCIKCPILATSWCETITCMICISCHLFITIIWPSNTSAFWVIRLYFLCHRYLDQWSPIIRDLILSLDWCQTITSCSINIQFKRRISSLGSVQFFWRISWGGTWVRRWNRISKL